MTLTAGKIDLYYVIPADYLQTGDVTLGDAASQSRSNQCGSGAPLVIGAAFTGR